MSKMTRPSSRTAAAECSARYSSMSLARVAGAIDSELPAFPGNLAAGMPAHPCCNGEEIRAAQLGANHPLSPRPGVWRRLPWAILEDQDCVGNSQLTYNTTDDGLYP